MDYYEIEQYFVDILCDSHKIAIDVGANIGHYIKTLLKNNNFVFAYEPIPELFEKLQNDFHDNVIIKNLALSDNIDGCILYIPIINNQPYYHLASCYNNFNNKYPTKILTVNTTTLDNEKIDNIGLIKIDVEGFEQEVIKGGVETIRHFKPNIIIEMEEKHRTNTIEVTSNYLYDIGYIGYYIDIFNGDVKKINFPQVKALQSKYINGKFPNYINNFIFVAKERSEYLTKEFEKKYELIKMHKRIQNLFEKKSK